MKIVAGILTILLGALPASVWCVLAFAGVKLGLLILARGDVAGLIVVAWGGAGIVGTVSLWAVGLGVVRSWVVAGLVAGIAALAPIAFSYSSRIGALGIEDIKKLSAISPVMVALVWLCVLFVCALPGSRWTSDDAASATTAGNGPGDSPG